MTIRGARLLGAVFVFVLGAFVMPPFSDGSFAAGDPVYFGRLVEIDPRASIIAPHPLFHAIVALATGGLSAAGVEHPGHVACRLVGAAGLSATFLLITSLSVAAPIIGFLLALWAVLCHHVLLNAATGETYVPAAFLAVLVLLRAASPRSRPMEVAALAALACLFRQDNILVMPGVLAAIVCRFGASRRTLEFLSAIMWAGFATLLLYLVAWLASGSTETFPAWLRHLGLDSYSGGPGLTTSKFASHVDELGVAVVGRHWRWSDPKLWLGPAILAAVLLPPLFARMSAPRTAETEPAGPLFSAALVALATRTVFFTWYDPSFAGWHVFTIVLVAAIAAKFARVRRAYVVLLAALIAITIAMQASHVVSLRQTTLWDAVQEALARSPSDAVLMTHTASPATALYALGRASEPLPDPLPDALAVVLRRRKESGRPIVVITDRFVCGGTPVVREDLKTRGSPFERAAQNPGLFSLAREGRVFALMFP